MARGGGGMLRVQARLRPVSIEWNLILFEMSQWSRSMELRSTVCESPFPLLSA